VNSLESSSELGSGEGKRRRSRYDIWASILDLLIQEEKTLNGVRDATRLNQERLKRHLDDMVSLGLVRPDRSRRFTCSVSGGPGNWDDYWAEWENTGGNVVGTMAIINATSWNTHSINGTVSTWVNLQFSGSDWIQAGLTAGYNDGNPPTAYSSSRIPYNEYKFYGSSSPTEDWWTSDPIPGSDNNAAVVYTASHNSDGTYTVEMFVNSTYYNLAFSNSENAGMMDYQGTPYLAGESIYLHMSQDCVEYDNYIYAASVSTTIGVTPTWSHWSVTGQQVMSSPPYYISQTNDYEYEEYCYSSTGC
jgi:hypothetical protein